MYNILPVLNCAFALEQYSMCVSIYSTVLQLSESCWCCSSLHQCHQGEVLCIHHTRIQWPAWSTTWQGYLRKQGGEEGMNTWEALLKRGQEDKCGCWCVLMGVYMMAERRGGNSVKVILLSHIYRKDRNTCQWKQINLMAHFSFINYIYIYILHLRKQFWLGWSVMLFWWMHHMTQYFKAFKLFEIYPSAIFD